MALLPGSAAIGLVAASACPAADQRGVSRPQGPACDAGAFEWAPPVLGALSATETGRSTAVVNATITNPDHQDPHLAVSYGTTTAYGSTTVAQDLGAGAAAVGASVPISGLKPGTVYDVEVVATNADGTSPSGDMTFVTTPATVLAPPTPTVNGFHQSATRWIEGSAPARASAKRTRPPIGTTFTFKLNESATYVIAFTAPTTGRRVKGRCVARTRRNRHMRPCSRSVAVGFVRYPGHTGVNRVAFQGRVAPANRLTPGPYTVTITATNAVGKQSKPQQLSFTIVTK